MARLTKQQRDKERAIRAVVSKRKKTLVTEVPNLLTADGLISWLMANDPESGHATKALQAACWFCAYQDAAAFLESAGTKDLARIFQDGHPGCKTIQDVNDFLEGYAPEEHPPTEEASREANLNVLKLLEEMGYGK